MRGYLCRLRTAEPTARPQPKSIWRCREGSCGQLRTQHRFGCPQTDPTTESYGCRAGQNRTPSSASSRSSGNVRDTRRWKVVATQRGPRSPPVRSTRTESRHEPSSSLVGSEVRNRSMASIPRAPAGSATAFAARTQTPRGPFRVLIVTSTRQVIGMPASDGRGIGVGAATPGGPAAPRVAGSRCPPEGIGAVEVHADGFESSTGIVDRVAPWHVLESSAFVCRAGFAATLRYESGGLTAAGLPCLASPRHAMCVHGTRIATGRDF